jgi:hypothetical protein
MRWIGIALLVATLGVTCLGQESQPSGEGSGLRIAENPRIELRADAAGEQQIADDSKTPLELRPQPGYKRFVVRAPGERDLIVWVPEIPTTTCYTMHVIQFDKDAEAPRKIGETTCTPAKGRLKLAQPEPNAQLTPAN